MKSEPYVLVNISGGGEDFVDDLIHSKAQALLLNSNIKQEDPQTLVLLTGDVSVSSIFLFHIIFAVLTLELIFLTRSHSEHSDHMCLGLQLIF